MSNWTELYELAELEARLLGWPDSPQIAAHTDYSPQVIMELLDELERKSQDG